MSMSEKELEFEEKQYLGYNKFSLFRRLVLAIFCFLIYFFSDEIPSLTRQSSTADLMFFMGIFVLVVSVILIFVLHMKTTIENNSVVIDGLWTARRVKIDLNSIVQVNKVDYSKYLLNRPVYNLHRKGKIKFFTRGNEAVELTDKDGLKYIIGSQRPFELYRLIKNKISSPQT